MYIQIQVACGSRSEAESIGSRLVEKGLVACAQISAPITSVYRWEGRIQSSEEWMCTMKTTEVMYDLVESEVCLFTRMIHLKLLRHLSSKATRNISIG